VARVVEFVEDFVGSAGGGESTSLTLTVETAEGCHGEHLVTSSRIRRVLQSFLRVGVT
jgi:hypothetical protein